MSVSADRRIAHVNGHFVPLHEAKISIMDRGFLFADGIYEVTAVLDGKMIDNGPHLARLDRSLKEIGIPNPHPERRWTSLQRELMALNALTEGLIYIEVTRGALEREFTYTADLQPSVVMFTQTRNIRVNPSAETGIAVITVPDLRWARRDIKSVALLAQVLAKQAAKEKGAGEALMVEDGFVTEGGSSTAFIITKAGEIITRPLSNSILPGVTRRSVMALAEKNGLAIVQRPFSVAEMLQAKEVFITSASSFVMPVVTVDGQTIGDGRPGALTRDLRRLYFDMASATGE